jgi:hypothetical protein
MQKKKLKSKKTRTSIDVAVFSTFSAPYKSGHSFSSSPPTLSFSFIFLLLCVLFVYVLCVCLQRAERVSIYFYFSKVKIEPFFPFFFFIFFVTRVSSNSKLKIYSNLSTCALNNQ